MSLLKPRGHSVIDYDLLNGVSPISVASLAVTGAITVGTAVIAANATGTQTSGIALTAFNNFVSSAGSAYSVTLPASYVGAEITVICTSATNTVTVFPNAGGTTTEKINALSANAGYAMAALTSTTFCCGVAGQWYTVPRVAS